MPTTTAELRLTGHQIGELTHILCELFKKDELVQVTLTQLDLDVFAEVASAQDSLKTVIFDLIAYLNRHQRIEEFLLVVVKIRPRSEELRVFTARTLSGSAPASSAEPARAAAAALGTAAETARDDPEVREMIGVGKAGFLGTREELDRLARYKGLHDCLHSLQLQLPAIVRTARAFPADSSAGRELQDYVKQFQSRVRRARQKAERLLTAEVELEWVDEFDGALGRARQAVGAAAAGDLCAAVDALGRLPPEAIRINGELVNAARRLGPGLGSLAKTLAALSERLEAQAHDAVVVSRLRDGSDGLFELAPRLASLTDAHDSWQWIDKELTAAENLPPAPPAVRVPRWDRVRTRLARVCPHGSALERDPEPLDLADRWQAEADPRAGDLLFEELRTTARHAFKQVDDDLLDLAEQLLGTIEPLDALLQVI